MKRAVSSGRRMHHEGGYALLLAVFLVASILIFVAAASPSLLTEGRREREQDAIWRGNQYVRAVRLYYQANGRFPQTMEDLGKASPKGVHFLRKAYKDPNNRADGSWRAIYVSPSGQLIGSVRYHSLQEMAAAKGFANTGVAAAAPASATQGATTGQATTGQTTAQAEPAGAAGTGQPTAAAAPPGQQSSFGTTTGFGSNSGFGSGFGSSLQPSAPGPLEAVDGPVLGGSLIGIGGKMKSPALLVVDGGKTYFTWEFIFNPLASANGTLPGATPAAGVAGVQPGAAATTGTQATPAAPQLGNGGLMPTGGFSPTQAAPTPSPTP